jgi:streptogramin lyase
VGGRIGHISPSGKVREFRVRNGLPYSIALTGNGRLWFASSFGGGIYRALDSIDATGHLSKPVCADPSCELESTVLATAPDGSLWDGLTMPHSIGGGGFTQIMEGETIADEAGLIAHLTP